MGNLTKIGTTTTEKTSTPKSYSAGGGTLTKIVPSTGTPVTTTPAANKNYQSSVQMPDSTSTFSGERIVGGGGRESNQFSLGKLLGGAAVKGVDEFISGLTSTAAWLENATLGTLFPGTTDNSPIQALNDRVQQAKKANQEYTAANVKAGGKAAEIVDKYGTATAAAIPQAGLAILTGGGSTAAQGTSAGLQAASSAAQAGTGFLSTVKSALSSLYKDPQYWLSFASTAGNSYEQAKADGTSDAKASLYALGNGLMSAAVEVGGGIQKLPGELQNGTKAFKAWLDTMLDEGKEEVVQGVLERGLQNLVYQKGNPLFSTEDESAILNPKASASEFAGGVVVGGLLGGGQSLFNGLLPGVKTSENTENRPTTPTNGVLPTTAPAEQKTAPNADNDAKAASEESTVINTDPTQHTAVEQRVIDEYQGAVDDNLVNFVETSIANKGSNKGRYTLKPVSDKAALDIKNLTGVNANGFKTVIEQRIAEHIVNRHGANGAANKSMADINDVARMQYVIDNYDRMEYGGKSTAYTTIKDNGKPGQADTVKYIKAVNGTYYVVEAVPDTKAKTTYIVSAYMDNKNEASNQHPVLADGPTSTPESAGAAKLASSDPTLTQPEPVVKSEGTESVGAAPSGFDPYSNMISEYGIIPEGENPARMVDLPKSTNGEDRVSYSARTVMEAQATPDAMLGDIANAVLSGELSHEVNTDAAAMERARNTVTDKGWEGSKETFHQMARKGVVSKDAVALGQVLLNNAMNSGDAAATIDILTDYASMSTTAAQSLQAQRMLKKLTPEGQLYGIQRSVKNLQEELVERYKDKAPNLEIPENLVQDFLDAQDQDARDAATAEIYKNIASQVPSTWIDKWNAWRYMAMLTNPRTHVRNIVGNLGFAPVRMVKNAIATTIETAADLVLPGGIQRTKAALNVASAEDRALIVAAFRDVSNVKGQLEGIGKYSDNAAGQIDEYRRIFKNPLLEGVRKGNTAAMTAEDTLFSAPAYAGALAGYLKANGVSAQSVTEGTVDGSVLDAARSYAVKEAQKATYRDQNAFSDFIAKANYKGDNPVGIAFSTLAEGVLPFRRTPANILARGIEYSPIGFLSAVSPIDIKIGRVRLAGDLAKLRKGEMTAAEVIDDASAGLTGIGLLALGAYLASQGLVSGGSSGDEEKDAMADLTGGQNYAVSIDGKNYTLDWLAPEALPFFVGVEAYNTLSDNSEEGVTLDTVLSAMNRITDPMLEMSMLQGVQDLIETVQYAEGGTLLKVAANAAISYLTQAIPTLFGQIERTTEGERATTFVDRTSGIPRDIQYTIGKAANKLPGEFQQIPYIDAWGRTESSGTAGERAFNNFINPSYTSVENETKADKEINRLLDAGYTGIAPDRVSQSQKVDGEYMNSEQYVEYATTKGQTSYDIVSDMIASDFYKGLTDEEKANVLSLAYTYAGHLAAEEITNGKHESEKYVELAQQAQKDLGLSEAEYLMYYKMYGGTTMNSDSLREAYDAGIGIETFIDYKEATSGLTADKDKDGKTISGSKKAKVIAEINELNIPSDAKDYLYLSAGYSEKELNNTPWH